LDLKEIHIAIDDLLNKQYQGYAIPSQKDKFINIVQHELSGELLPAYGANIQLHDYLRPFRKKMTLLNGNTVGGAIALPSDYNHLLLVELNVVVGTTTKYQPCELLGDDEISYRKNSQVIPAAEYPFVYFDEGGLQLHPATPVAGTLRYLRKPQDCQFVYTQVGRTITYDAVNSKQLEWNDEATVKIIDKTVARLALYLRDQMALQVATAKGGAN
jgi:hypothetical protein